MIRKIIRDVYIFILSHDTDKIKIETYVMCTPYMEAVTAVRLTFEYRYPNIVNQDQEQRVSINKTRNMAGHLLFQTVVFGENENKFG